MQDHQQRQRDGLGDLVYVQIPAVGTAVAAGESFSEIESTKSVSDVYAPLTGTVVTVNDALAESPQLLNEDPYGDGWLCEIELADEAEFENLLDAAAYRSLVEG